MNRRHCLCIAFAALCSFVFTKESSASVTFNLEDVVIVEGSTSGSFRIFFEVTAPDLGLQVGNFNVSAELGVGTLGGVTILPATLATTNALIPLAGPVNDPTRPANTIRFSVDAGIGVFHPAAPDPILGAKRMAVIPFTLAAPAVAGQSVSLVFMDLSLPFNNYTPSVGGSQSNLTTLNLSPGSITVAAVPEPSSMLAIGAICIAGGVRRHRRKRQSKLQA